jgi:hypothetical protein
MELHSPRAMSSFCRRKKKTEKERNKTDWSLFREKT